MITRSALLCASLLSLAASGHAIAQGYPTKPIRFVVPYAPGGGTDLMARTIAQKLNEAWQQPVIVDHRPGATGTLGSLIVARSAPDGYTLLLVTSGTHAIAPNLQSKPTYHPADDFAAVTLTGTAAQVLVVHPSTPATTVKDVVALAKDKPGALNYASPGPGTTAHMTAEMFKMATGVQITHIPYKGGAAAARDLLGGQVQLMFSAPGAVIQHARAGKLRVLAAATRERTAELKDVPTFAELGYPGVEASIWYGILTTTGTPRAVVDTLNREMVRILKLPEIKESFARQGYEPATASPEEFSRFIRAELVKWGKVVKASGMQLD